MCTEEVAGSSPVRSTVKNIFMETTICLFGNSITWGAGDLGGGGWGARLRNYFETNKFDIELYNLGVSGDTSDDLLKRFKIESAAREPCIIIFAIGVNDSQYINSKDNPRVPFEKFQSNLQKLIDQAKKFTSKIIFVGLTKVDEFKTRPIPWSVTKYYNEKNAKLYDSKIKEVCEENNISFLKMYDLLNDSDLADGLHPNPAGHEKMFLRIKEFLLSKKLI